MRTLCSLRFLILAFVILAIPATSLAQFGVSITVAPPELAVYAQPICPQEGYIWTPGYWAYGEDGYYWVPGTWVEPPGVGLLWTPGYWGWDNDRYAWNEGYWGPEVGFYGGVNYGYGYGGVGYDGGYWRNNQFSYNTYVNNVGSGRFHNTYSKRVNVNTRNYVSYNGGSGGLTARPSAAEESAADARQAPTAAQSGHQRVASQNHELLASVNHGHPPIAATSKPGEFTGKGIVAARGSSAENRSAENEAAATRTSENRAAASQPTRNSERSAQPSARSETSRPAVRPVRANPSASPARQAAPPRTESAPKAAASQREAAPRQAAAPRSEPSHQSAPRQKPTKSEQR